MLFTVLDAGCPSKTPFFLRFSFLPGGHGPFAAAAAERCPLFFAILDDGHRPSQNLVFIQVFLTSAWSCTICSACPYRFLHYLVMVTLPKPSFSCGFPLFPVSAGHLPRQLSTGAPAGFQSTWRWLPSSPLSCHSIFALPGDHGLFVATAVKQCP